MTSARLFQTFVLQHRSQLSRASSEPAAVYPLPTELFSRRNVLLICAAPLNLATISPALLAREKRSRKSIPMEEYNISSDGLKYYDLAEGKGPIAESGTIVKVHFDCIYHGITAVSSRESKLLAGNRIIAQPYEFKVGSPPGKERKHGFVDNANGLYSAQAAPKPPPAMYIITEGMRVGGKHAVLQSTATCGTPRVPLGSSTSSTAIRYRLDRTLERLQCRSNYDRVFCFLSI